MLRHVRFFQIQIIMVFLFQIGLPFPVYANETHWKIMLMSKDQQKIFLEEYLVPAGFACKVVNTYYQGMMRDQSALWDATCENGHSYVLRIMPDDAGTAYAVDCEVIARSKYDRCFVPYSPK